MELNIALSNVEKALKSRKIFTISETISLYTHNPSLGFWAALSTLASAVSMQQGLSQEVAIALNASSIAAPTIFKFLQRSVTGGNQLPNPATEFAYAYLAMHQLR